MRILASLSLVSLLAIGCGGNVSPEEGIGATDDSAVSEAGGGDGAIGPSEDGSIVPPGEDGSVVPPDEDGGVAPPPPGDASVPPPPPVDAGGGTGGIKCGTATCNSATQDCCTSLSGQKCVTKGTCTGGATLSCTDSSACKSGEVCCASGGAGGGGAKCAATCTMGVVLCATDADCKAPQKCMNALGGTKTCRNPPPGGMDGGFGGFDAGGFGGFDAAFDTKFFGG